MIYTFNRDETLDAVASGQKRTDASKKRKDNWGLVNNNPVEDSRRQTVGSLGEAGVCRLFDQPFLHTVNTFKAPDLVVNGWGLQVKASEHAKNLTIRPDAKDFEPYILCHVEMPLEDPRLWHEIYDAEATYHWSEVTILGWMFPYIARLWADLEPSLWRDPNGRNSPAIFIPADWLNSIESLQDLTQTPASEYTLV